MVSSDLWTDIDSKFAEKCMIIHEKSFASCPVTTVADFLQLPPLIEKLIFSQFFNKNSMKYILGLQLWHLFKYAELTKVLVQNDKLFINLLDKVPVGNIDCDVELLLIDSIYT